MKRRSLILLLGGMGSGCLRLSDQANDEESVRTTAGGGDATGDGEDREPREAIFSDDFTDGTFENRWEYVAGSRDENTSISESGTTLRHDSPVNYGDNEPIQTQQSIEANGVHRIVANVRTNLQEYNGFGVNIQGEGGRIALKNNKWEGFDRFAIYGVTNRPDEFSSDYGAYGEQMNKAKLAPATTSTSFIEYSIRINFDEDLVTAASRGDETWDLSLPIQDIGDSYRLSLPAGGGHDVEYDYVSVSSEEATQ
jgi:hypothetical protein